MKHQKWIILSVALVLIAGTAGALTWLRANQKLGRPGIKAEAIPGSVMMKINLPERVLDFTSTNVPDRNLCWIICRRTRVMPNAFTPRRTAFGFRPRLF